METDGGITGLTDIPWMGTFWKPNKMPLQNYVAYTRFALDDLRAVFEVQAVRYRGYQPGRDWTTS